MKGPNPGMANAPIPANNPSVPPTAPPAVTPVVVPSGAFVFFSCAVPLALSVSGTKTEVPLRKARRNQIVDCPLSDGSFYTVQIQHIFTMMSPKMPSSQSLFTEISF